MSHHPGSPHTRTAAVLASLCAWLAAGSCSPPEMVLGQRFIEKEVLDNGDGRNEPRPSPIRPTTYRLTRFVVRPDGNVLVARALPPARVEDRVVVQSGGQDAGLAIAAIIQHDGNLLPLDPDSLLERLEAVSIDDYLNEGDAAGVGVSFVARLPFAGRDTRLSWSLMILPDPAGGTDAAIGVAQLDHTDIDTGEVIGTARYELALEAIGT
ncbi:MAG: hypothetical protein IPM29_26925 [Planctomycetes bacterium]|nr:hypothetical protein [Planctomycetota bacterium]